MAYKYLNIPWTYSALNTNPNNVSPTLTGGLTLAGAGRGLPSRYLFINWLFDPLSYKNSDKHFESLSFMYNPHAVYDNLYQQDITVYLKNDGESVYSTKWLDKGVAAWPKMDDSFGTNTWYELILATKNSDIIWGVVNPNIRIQSHMLDMATFAMNSHIGGGEQAYFRIKYTEKTPDKPIPINLQPTLVEVDSTKSITFSWDYNIGKVGPQKSFVLEYSVDDWVTKGTITETTTRQSYTIPAYTLDGDSSIKWRVKVTGDYWNNEGDFTTTSFTTKSIKPYLTGVSPNGGVVDSRNPILMQWNHNSIFGGIQEEFTLEYSIDNWTTKETITEETSRQNYTFPALFFDGEIVVDWRIKTVDSIYQNESNFFEAKFTTGMTAQRPPTILSPYGEYLDVVDDTIFEWIFMGHPGEFQTKYEINWSRNGGATWFNIINESSNDYHIVLGNTFTTGTITWRIRTWNNYDEISPWSEVKSFYLIGRPATPVITDVSNRTKPTIKWTADTQQVYELDILQGQTLIYTSGKIASLSTFEHFIDKYLANGSYKARLRVKNQYDLWSAYGERNFIINRDSPDAPIINVISGEYQVTITATGLSEKSYVYRDNILLGDISNIYEDYTGVNNKEYEYFVRTINDEGNFTDSVKRIGKCSFRGNTLALEKEPSDFLLLKFNLSNKPDKSINASVDGKIMKFDGREYSTFEFDDSKSFDKTVTFNIEDEPLSKLIQLINNKTTLIYRDYFEENIYGVVQKVAATKSVLGYIVEFTIIKMKEV